MTHEDKENPTKYKAYCFGKYEEKSVFCRDRCRYKNQCKKGKENAGVEKLANS